MISLVIPSHQARSQLRRALGSLQPMLAPDLEVIVVDDGSTDGTAEMVRREFPWARLVVSTWIRGRNGAKNLGLSAATGEIVAFLDSDCEVDRGWLRAAREAIRSGADAVTGPVRHGSGFRQQLIALLDFPDFQTTRAARVSNFASCNVVLRRAVLDEAPFDPALPSGGDRLLAWRLAHAGRDVRYVPALAVHHRPDDDLRSLLRRRVRYGLNAVLVRRRERTVPGARLLRFGLLAPLVLVGAPIARDLCRLPSLVRCGAIGGGARALLLGALATALRTAELSGMYAGLFRPLEPAPEPQARPALPAETPAATVESAAPARIA
jgi:glycosyltransferase involved in cell wall biosynthesis